MGLHVKQFSRPGSCPNTAEVFGIGKTDEMMRLVMQLRRLPSDVTGLAQQFVSLEIQSHSAHVGPPVDVVRLTADGVDWVTLKLACQA